MSVRRPWFTMTVAAVCVLLALASLRRTVMEGSLHALLGDDSPASAALGRIIREYRSPDDLLVLASLPDSPPELPAGADALTAFAVRLKEAIAASPEARSLCRQTSWESDPAISKFLQGSVIPAGLYYLDDAGFEAIKRRISLEGMREQFRKNEALIASAGPTATTLAEAMLRDPLRLRDFVTDRFGGSGGFTSSGNKPDFSTDGRSLLVRIQGVRSADDLDFASHLTDVVSQLAHAVNPDQLDIRVSGGYAIASYTSGSIRSDMIISTLSSVALIYLVLLALYRSWISPMLIGGIAGVGILCGFGFHALLKPGITPLTAVLGAMLGGLGVDYANHLLSHYQANRHRNMTPRTAAIFTVRQICRPLFTACLTTALGFITLIGTEVAMLRDFAVLGSLGLSFSFLAVVILMPAALTMLDRRQRTPMRAGKACAPWTARNAVLSLSLSLGVVGLAAGALAMAPGFLPQFETNRTVMHPRPNPPLETSELIAERFSLGESLLVEINAPTPDQLVTRCHDAERALHASASPHVTSILGLSTLLPDPRATEDRRRGIADLDPDRIAADLQTALIESGFEPAAFEGYARFLRQLADPPAPPELADVLSNPQLSELLFPMGATLESATRTILVARLDHHLRERVDRQRVIEELRAALQPVTGATLTGFSVVSFDLEQAARVDLPRFAAVSLLLVTGWLAFYFRRFWDVALAMSCIVFAAVCMLGFMVMAGERLNTISVISIPLLVGVSIDNGVFLVTCYRRATGLEEMLEEFRASTQAIVACGATTMLAFGTLYWTSTPAIQSFGLIVAVGIGAAIWGALGMLMPLLVLLKSRQLAARSAAP